MLFLLLMLKWMLGWEEGRRPFDLASCRRSTGLFCKNCLLELLELAERYSNLADPWTRKSLVNPRRRECPVQVFLQIVYIFNTDR